MTSAAEGGGVTVASVASMRLVGGKTDLEGRVQITIGGKDGTICADGWDAKDAQVACRQLGLTGGTPASFGSDSLPALVSNVACKGNESRLASCKYDIGKPCSGSGAAGVKCQKPAVISVRLRFQESPFPLPSPSLQPGISPAPCCSGPLPIPEGRVEVLLSGGQYGPVCDRGFGTKEAQVVCRMAGKTGGRAIMGGAFGNALQPAVLDQLVCAGFENNLTSCNYVYTPEPRCNSHAAVECEQPPPMAVRLRNGKNGNEGRLEVEIGGTWSTVCQDLFTDAAAAVVCRKLGLNGGRTLRGVKWGATGLGVGISNVRCLGSEDELSACQFSTKPTGCTHAKDVGVACKPPTVSSVSIINGSTSGYPVVSLDGPIYRSGPICSDGFKNSAARVVCRMAGYADGYVLPTTGDPADVKPMTKVMNHVYCKGTERDLTRCSYDATTECKSKRAVKVKCTAQPIQGIRLVGGALKGLLQVKVRGQWGGICSVGFGKQEAEVACRQLGHSGGRVIGGGDSFHQAVIGDVVCAGTEASLNACEYDSDQSPNNFDEYR
ncbi:hypothetical protein ABPG75_007598 [Micractinium tetrahymenae]